MLRYLNVLVGLSFLASCSQPVDTRPIVEGTGFGFAFAARVTSVAPIRSVEDERSIFPEFAGAVGRDLAFEGDPFEPDFTAEAIAIGAAALTDSNERFVQRTRCMYFLEVEDPAIQQLIMTTVLSEGVDPAFFDKALVTQISTELTLAQACNPNVKVGSLVTMTYSASRGTIHPMSPEFSQRNAAQIVLQDAPAAAFSRQNGN